MTNPTISAPADWWDARRPGSFFEAVYRRGDESLEGWLESSPMDLAARTAREAAGAAWVAGIADGDRILDCPCGLGRHTSALAAMGFNVTGVDLDPALSTLASDVQRAGPQWARADMRALPFRDDSFTVALNLVLSFGFFDDEADDWRVIREFARVLKPGGRLVVHTDVNPERIADGTYGDREWRNLPGGARLRVREHYVSDRRRLEGAWELYGADGRRTADASYSLRVYRQEELALMFTESGLRVTSWYGALEPDARAFSSSTQEVVAVAIKDRREGDHE